MSRAASDPTSSQNTLNGEPASTATVTTTTPTMGSGNGTIASGERSGSSITLVQSAAITTIMSRASSGPTSSQQYTLNGEPAPTTTSQHTLNRQPVSSTGSSEVLNLEARGEPSHEALLEVYQRGRDFWISFNFEPTTTSSQHSSDVEPVPTSLQHSLNGEPAPTASQHTLNRQFVSSTRSSEALNFEARFEVYQRGRVFRISVNFEPAFTSSQHPSGGEHTRYTLNRQPVPSARSSEVLNLEARGEPSHAGLFQMYQRGRHFWISFNLEPAHIASRHTSNFQPLLSTRSSEVLNFGGEPSHAALAMYQRGHVLWISVSFEPATTSSQHSSDGEPAPATASQHSSDGGLAATVTTSGTTPTAGSGIGNCASGGGSGSRITRSQFRAYHRELLSERAYLMERTSSISSGFSTRRTLSQPASTSQHSLDGEPAPTTSQHSLGDEPAPTTSPEPKPVAKKAKTEEDTLTQPKSQAAPKAPKKATKAVATSKAGKKSSRRGQHPLIGDPADGNDGGEGNGSEDSDGGDDFGDMVDAITAEPLEAGRYVSITSPDGSLTLRYNCSTLIRISLSKGQYLQPPHFREPMTSALKAELQRIVRVLPDVTRGGDRGGAGGLEHMASNDEPGRIFMLIRQPTSTSSQSHTLNGQPASSNGESRRIVMFIPLTSLQSLQSLQLPHTSNSARYEAIHAALLEMLRDIARRRDFGYLNESMADSLQESLNGEPAPTLSQLSLNGEPVPTFSQSQHTANDASTEVDASSGDESDADDTTEPENNDIE